MRYKRLGSSGLKVSAIGLGGNTFGRSVDAAGTARIIHHAIDQGINFFDTADVYTNGVSEDHVGKALADRRDKGLIASKVAMKMGDGPNDVGLSRAHIIAGVEASLRRLGTDYLDLLQVHRWDPETPIQETMEALNDLVRSGKVRYIGCSNFTAWQLTQSLWVSDKRGYAAFVSVQPRYSLLDRAIEAELVPACRAFGIGVIPFSPLAGGILTGKYRGGARPEGTRGALQEGAGFFERQMAGKDESAVERLVEWAEARGKTVGDLAIAWLSSQPEISSVIAGINTTEQVDSNVSAAEWALSAAEIAEVGKLVG